MKALLFLVLIWATRAPSLAAERDWRDALRQMSLPPNLQVNRDNAVEVFLDTFRSNATVKAMVFLPGVADDFYLIHRDAPKLNLRATNLLDAIIALTNATEVRVSFQEPFLLLHVQRDVLQAACTAEDERAARALKESVHLPRACWKDAHWEAVQPAVQNSLRRPVRPKGSSPDAWHFNRHNLAEWGLSDWELLQALCLAGGTKVIVQKRDIVFQARGIL